MIEVTRSIGDLNMKAYLSCEPFIQEMKLLPVDSHLILACDGVFIYYSLRM